jgi:hypothetical protein
VTSWPQVIQPIFVARGETCAWITFHVVIAKALGESQETLAGMMIARTYGFALRRESTRIKEGGKVAPVAKKTEALWYARRWNHHEWASHHQTFRVYHIHMAYL